MFKISIGNSMWQLVMQSDTMSKLVMLVLLGMSIMCWTLFLYRLVLLRIKRRQVRNALMKLYDIHTNEQLVSCVASLDQSMPGYFLHKNLSLVRDMLSLQRQAERPGLTAQQWQSAEQMIQQVATDMIMQEEAHLSFLSMSASVSPLLGLFGTVWGLVHAFIRISEKQTADIATVAPGIAEALMTTLFGLMVAIPALVMYHYVQVHIGRLEKQLYAMAEQFSVLVQKLFVW